MNLSCCNVSKGFSGILAVDGVDVDVRSGEIVGIIGPNGSGKSTLLSMMSGFYEPDAGTISLDGEPLHISGSHRFRRLGVARTFQNARIFDDLSVRDNVLAGLHTRLTAGRGREWNWIGAVGGLPTSRRRERSARTRCEEFLHVAGLTHVADLRAGGCSYGQRKRIELARAMIGEPRVLLLDEPMAGIPVDGIASLVEQLIKPARADGVAIALVEHRVELILDLCDRLVVLAAGRSAGSAPATTGGP
jgi:ABC-type branched-subunit amino acid transport system ATPase component